jgi:signal transduction histidine kinase
MPNILTKITGSRTKPALAAEVFLNALTDISGFDELLAYVCAELRKASGATAVHAFLREPITNRFSLQHTSGVQPDVPGRFSISDSGKLLKWFTTNRIPLAIADHESVLSYLTPPEHEFLRGAGIMLVIPCFVLDRITCAFFFARNGQGGKLATISGYGPESIAALSRLTSQAALALEHARMHELQEERLKKLYMADRLATIGELAARAAHEIRNPLAFIRSTVQLLQSQIPAEKSHLAAELITESDRIDAIIAGLLSLSRSTTGPKTNVNLRDLIEHTLPLLQSELTSRGIEIFTDWRSPDASIKGDPAQLRQLLLNLLINSMQATPGAGKIVISLEDRDTPGRRSVLLTISDTGQGIPSDLLPRVFDPFFTTKETGTGLGLSICYGIVANHGGEIDIRSSTAEDTHGTTVSIRFPSFS